jgi:hypothetical protein
MSGMAKELVVKKWRNVTHRVVQYPDGHIYEFSEIPKSDGGGFGRSDSEFWIKDLDQCDCCGLDKKVLRIDTSEGEYGDATLCLPCITDLFNGEHLK